MSKTCRLRRGEGYGACEDVLTRRDIIIKWSSYAAVTLALMFLCTLTLRDLRVLGVTVFLPPLFVGVVASLEDTPSAAVYALVCGFFCDLAVPGTFPCVYTLAFTAAALACSLLAKSVLQRGFLCSSAVTALTFFCVDALNMLALFFTTRASLPAMASVALRETLVSCLLLPVCHPVLTYLNKKFTL